jgi:ABC-2 type transport system ATP-binding protein
VTLLDLQDLSAGYGRQAQLRELSLTLPEGQSLAILGVNGVGKTTLLKCLLGLNQPLAGSVRIMGGDPRRASTRQNFAFLPERFAPSPLLTGLDIMRLTRLSYGLAHDRPAAVTITAPLGLSSDQLKSRLRTYSKGMVQKLGLAAALYSERKLLILDEPFSGLDPVARAALVEVLQAYRAGGGSLILTSHLLPDLDRLCDVVMMLADGRAVFTGAPADFRALDPHNNDESAFRQLAKAAP